MTIDLVKLKALATATAANQHDAQALNDYGMAVPPTTMLDLIAEIESHRLIDNKDCKPVLNNQPFNGINSGDVQRLIQVIDTLISYAEAETSNTCCEENAEKGWTAIEAARGLLDEINVKNGIGVRYRRTRLSY